MKRVYIDGIFDLCRLALKKGYKIFVVTNQAGIGKGYYSEEDFSVLNTWMCEEFSKRGIQITKVFYSPYHIDATVPKYKKDHYFRKPNPGMILEAQKQFDIDLQSSIMVGDKITDVEAGISAKVGVNVLLDPKNFKSNKSKYFSVETLKDIMILL